MTVDEAIEALRTLNAERLRLEAALDDYEAGSYDYDETYAELDGVRDAMLERAIGLLDERDGANQPGPDGRNNLADSVSVLAHHSGIHDGVNVEIEAPEGTHVTVHLHDALIADEVVGQYPTAERLEAVLTGRGVHWADMGGGDYAVTLDIGRAVNARLDAIGDAMKGEKK